MEEIINAVCDEFTQTTVTKNRLKRKKFVSRLIAALEEGGKVEQSAEDQRAAHAISALQIIRDDPNVKLKDARKLAEHVLEEPTPESEEEPHSDGDEEEESEEE